MAIIRNDRRAREAQAEAQKSTDKAEELVTDHSWHPSIEEFDPGITTEEWLEMLDDPTVFDEDGLHAVECLHAFGGPTTLQQMSVRFRGTMGRYRRWLNTTAQRVGRRRGIAAPQQDQFGNDEWWPLLYQRRAIGKVGANVHELRLRDELADALTLREANKKAKKREADLAEAQERERKARERAQQVAAARDRAAAERAAVPDTASERRAARQARAEREERLASITVDRNTESVPGYDEPPEPEPQPTMTKAQAAVAARIAAAQQRVGGEERGGSERGAQSGADRGGASVTVAQAAAASRRVRAEEANQRQVEAPVAEPVASESMGTPSLATESAEAAAKSSAPADAASTKTNFSAATAYANAGADSANVAVAQGSAANAQGVVAFAANVPTCPLPVASIQAYFDALDASEEGNGNGADSVTAAKRPNGASTSGTTGASARSSSKNRRGGNNAGRKTSAPDSSAQGMGEAIHMPLDYATRYSNRLWNVFDLMRAGNGSAATASRGLAGAAGARRLGPTAARVARELGLESVEPVQRMLNGEDVPKFSLVDGICRVLGANHEYLEAPDEATSTVAPFASVRDLCRDASIAQVLGTKVPKRIVFVKDDQKNRHASVVVAYNDLRWLLLDGVGAPVDEDPSQNEVVAAFLNMVHDLQDFAMQSSCELASADVSASEWHDLQSGRVWPGTLLDRH